MSVPKGKQGLSGMEFYHNARKLRKEMKEFLRRDFGVHSRKNAHNIDPSLPDDWYDEDIIESARNIRLLLRNLIWNITAANTIYAKNEKDLANRRYYQTSAIINCQQLIQELQDCEDTLPISAEKYMPYIKSINFEIVLLKEWRKSDNRLAKMIESVTVNGVMEFINFENAKSAIDLGCGNGKLTAILKSNGLNVTGIDISEQMLEIARKEHPGINFICTDATDFSIEKKVDVIFSKGMIHWVKTEMQDSMLSCISAALKKGGQFVFETGGYGCNELIHNELAKVFVKYGYEYKNPFYFPTVSEYTSLVEKHGMKVVKAEVHNELSKLTGRDGLLKWITSVDRQVFVQIKDSDVRQQIVLEVANDLRDKLCKNGRWYADYVYIRMEAIKI